MRKRLKLKHVSMIAGLMPVIAGGLVAAALVARSTPPPTAVLSGAVAGIVVALAASWALASWVGGVIAASRDSIAKTAHDISATVDQRQRLAAQQAAAADATTAAMEKLAASTSHSAAQADDLAVGARQVLTLADEGARTVTQTLRSMTSLNEKVHAIAQMTSHLNEQASEIGSITNMVGEVASQTNLLALNAAVEAARAGEQGRGFSVVAAEIRKLADQTKSSAGKINTLVNGILQTIGDTVKATEDGTRTVEESVQTANQTVQAFIGVRDAISKATENTQHISTNVRDQSLAVDNVLRSMTEFGSNVRVTAATLGQGRTRAEALQQTAAGLGAII
ncbi:MAG TPA: methyl-accepting chemotaxis protein [Vicinamibacterales bacterium]|jgi:methyl-accepting chemotaxis protein|nr:methyl-accepting chemotaxis protein [Vicinamibacterales bacterium]